MICRNNEVKPETFDQWLLIYFCEFCFFLGSINKKIDKIKSNEKNEKLQNSVKCDAFNDAVYSEKRICMGIALSFKKSPSK